MITHKKNQLIAYLFSKLAEHQMRKHFRRVSWTRRSVMPELNPELPTIAILNHSAWWDAMLCLYLGNIIFKQDCYGVFAEEQLKRYGIFRYAGCYSVNRSSAADFKAFLKYSHSLLESKSRLVWIFPQGELVSNDARPFDFKKGFAVMASKLKRVQVLKMAVSYDFWIDSRPEAVVDILPVDTFDGSEINPDVYAGECGYQIGDAVSYIRNLVVHRRYEELVPLFETNHGTNPVYDLWRRSASMIRGEKFVSTHGENISR